MSVVHASGRRAVPGDGGFSSAVPVVIGHRGASGYRPEHTLASYRLAIALGADYVEPDLVSTADGVLVARHENEISRTTDVAEHVEFADRHRTTTVDGTAVTGWFTEDFTLSELRSLRAVERIPGLRPRNARYDGRYRVPTFAEVLALVSAESRRLGRPVGVYPETKHPGHFRAAGLPLEPPLVDALDAAGLNRPDAQVLVQSFEVGSLRALRSALRVPLVQLLDVASGPADLVAAGGRGGGLREITGYADAIGPHKELLVPRDAAGRLGPPTGLLPAAHAAGLRVHAYTFRDENAFLATDHRRGDDPAGAGDAFAEYRLFFGLGVDGVFTDQPDTAAEARAEYLARRAA